MSQPIYLTADIRRVEQAAGDVTPPLMERAGAAAAELAEKIVAGKDILVLAGPGNNGGDARIAAARLQERFFRVAVAASPGEIPQDRNWGLVIDGLFGIGLARNIGGEHAALVEYANRQRCPVLALDVPSGIQSDTGQVLGCAVRATHTLTFIALKPGLLTLDGPDYAGEISVAGLQLDLAELQPPAAWVAGPELFENVLRRRPRNFHKGAAGSVGVLGGARGMSGAALLAGRAALKLGAGRTYVGLLEPLAVDPAAPELMLRHADDLFGLDLDAVVAGPGLGRTGHAATLVGAVLTAEMPCVLDADALNLMAEDDDLRLACERRKSDTLLTPHPAEAGRLLGIGTEKVQADRVAAARALSKRYSAHVVLKGNGSIVVAHDGHLFVNRSGNPGMASAGMGDVLSGILGTLLAQRFPGEAALALGVHLHGCAADELAASGVGPVGLAAGELLEPARRIWNRWLR